MSNQESREREPLAVSQGESVCATVLRNNVKVQGKDGGYALYAVRFDWDDYSTLVDRLKESDLEAVGRACLTACGYEFGDETEEIG